MIKSDPFRNIEKDDGPASIKLPGTYIGIVKTVDATTRTVTVLVTAVNATNAIGPARVMAPISGATPSMPAIGTKVVVTFLNGTYDTLVVLGKYV